MPKDKNKKEMSFTNKVRSILGKDPLPKASAKDVGYAGSRMKKKTRTKKKY